MTYLPAYDDNNGWEPTPGDGGAEPGTQPKTLWYMQDGLGSTIGLAEKDGRVSARYHYDEFGAMLDSKKIDLNWPGPDSLFGYTGLGYDYSSSLTYARARYYQPELGRFISGDTYKGTLRNPQSQNLYTYVHNNPLRYVDPSGHYIESAADVAFIILDVVNSQLTPSAANAKKGILAVVHSIKSLSKSERTEIIRDGKMIMSYFDLRKLSKGTGLEAHHLVEKRLAKQLGVKQDDTISCNIKRCS